LKIAHFYSSQPSFTSFLLEEHQILTIILETSSGFGMYVYLVEYAFPTVILCNSVGTVLGIGFYGHTMAGAHATGK